MLDLDFFEQKYRKEVYESVFYYYLDNYGKHLEDWEIDELPNEQVLKAYLEWNGIIGYTSIIIHILEAK